MMPDKDTAGCSTTRVPDAVLFVVEFCDRELMGEGSGLRPSSHAIFSPSPAYRGVETLGTDSVQRQQQARAHGRVQRHHGILYLTSASSAKQGRKTEERTRFVCLCHNQSVLHHSERRLVCRPRTERAVVTEPCFDEPAESARAWKLNSQICQHSIRCGTVYLHACDRKRSMQTDAKAHR